MMAEVRRPDRQEPPAPQPPPFDFDAENLGRQQINNDQETFLVELMT